MPPDGNPADTGNKGGATGTEEAPKYVTEDAIAQIVNAAVSSHLKRSLGKAIEEAIKPVAEQLSQLKTAREEAPPQDTKKKSDVDPEVVALKKQVADLTTAMQRSAEEAAAAQRQAREEKAYASLRDQLQGKVRPEALPIALDVIRARKLLTINEDGTVTFRHRAALAKGMEEQDHEFPLDRGVGEFLKSKDAALFLPAPGGPGPRQGNRPPHAPTPQPRPEAPRYDQPALTEWEQDRRIDERLAKLGVSFED